MINLSRDIQSLSTFKRNTNELIIQMKETGNPVVLTVNGKAELVVQDLFPTSSRGRNAGIAAARGSNTWG